MTGSGNMHRPKLKVVVVIIVICTALYGIALGQEEPPARYDGYQLWRVVPQSNVELDVLSFLADKYNLTFWLQPSAVGRQVDIMVPPSSLYEIISFFKRSFSSFEVLQTDIQKLITAEYKDRALPGLEYQYDKYHSLDEIDAWIDSMVNKHRELVTKIRIGTSYEARTISGLKISVPAKTSRNHSNRTNAGKPSIFIEGGIHAREWISPATVVYMTNQLLKQYQINADVTKILNAFDWYILPVFNVDGYVFTWTNNRLWRKTRSPTTNPLCKGTDPNRNWDNHWCDNGASKNPCSETYCGSRAFSEVEVQAVSSFLSSGINFVGFIDFHSYSQLWMTPYGWSNTLPKSQDYFKQNAQSERSVLALEAVHGTNYEYGTIANTLYTASGNSVDWTYENAGILYSATVELRDMGQYGFLLPANQIIPTGQETFEGLKQYALFILNSQ